MTYLTLKGLHIAFMVTWFAGLFYLPRLFIYHRAAEDATSLDRFVVMERRLFAIMTLGAIVTLAFGLGLLAVNSAVIGAGWFHAKIALLVGLTVYHWYCLRLMHELRDGRCQRSDKWLRWYNEVPVIFLLSIILLAVIKPF